MNLDDHLRDVLTDDRWALPVPPDALQGVRRRRAVRRRRTAAAGLLGLALAGGALALLPSGGGDTLQQYAAGEPVPGISPDWTPTHGRDWVMENAEYDAWIAEHTVPRTDVSPGPDDLPVASPAPLGPKSAELLALAEEAGFPEGTTFRREDANGGDPHYTVLHVTLPGGIPMVITRFEPLSGRHPYAFHRSSSDGVGADVTEVDVPGTTAAALLAPTFGYGFPGERLSVVDGRPTGAHGVTVIEADGRSTSWIASSRVPMADVQRWAFTATQAG